MIIRPARLRRRLIDRRGESMTRRFLGLLAVVGVAGVGIVAAASGANGNSGSTSTGSESIGPVVLSASTCSELTTDVTLNGTANFSFHLSFDARGVGHVSGAEAIRGTGVGDDGSTYTFNYHDATHATITSFPFWLNITDHFILIGSGGQQIHTFFNAAFLIDESGQPIDFRFDNVIGDPEFCDPL
jgi:hypothetical protein